MWELDHKEGWAPKNWCLWNVLETIQGFLDSEIKPANPKGNQSRVFIGKTDAEAEATAVIWPPDVKSRITGKDRCWERLKAGGEGADRRWDGWMASPTQWKWVWASSRSWWWTGVLQSMGSQRVGHDRLNISNLSSRINEILRIRREHKKTISCYEFTNYDVFYMLEESRLPS